MAKVYKLVTHADWDSFQRAGTYAGAPVDLADGFIHFSYADQVQATAEKHFRGRDGLVLFACDGAALGDALKDEVSRGGDLFPHLFRSLHLADVLWSRPAPLSADGVPLIRLEEA